MHRPRIAWLVFALFLLPLPALAGDDIWTAAGGGDLERVRQLVESGVEIDAPTRYGATALTFAAQKGHGEVVDFLLEKGADPNPRDTFYNSTPLDWAIAGRHAEIGVALVEHGAGGLVGALLQAVQTNLPEIAAAIVDAGPLPAWAVEAARQALASSTDEDFKALVEKAETYPELRTVEVDPAMLEKLAGKYRIKNGERALAIAAAEGALLVSGEGEEGAARYVPVGFNAFRRADDPNLGLYFYGRSDTVEGALYLEGASQVFYEPITADDEEPEKKARRPLFAPKDGPAASEETAEKLAALPAGAAKPWPSFRGPGARGVADGQGAVADWDVTSGKNVRWKTKIPGLGLSSPIVWGERVFLTTAISAAGDDSLKTGLYGSFDSVDDSSEHVWQVLALDAGTGEILWQRDAGRAVPSTERHTKASQANSTPVTDGRRVVAVFPTVGMFCYSVDGELLWKKDLGALAAGWFYDPSYQWGFASSPILDGDRVILQADVQEGAFVAAYDLETGAEVWRVARDEIPTWATPTVVQAGESRELILNGSTIRGYDPRDGRELWHLGPNSEVIIATPIESEGLVYVSAGYPPAKPIYAIRPGGRGDLTLASDKTASESVAWSHDRGGAYMPTPLVYRGVFYIGHHDNRLVAYDAKTGERIYRARFSRGGTFTGSPVAADGRLYFVTEDGLVYVVAAGRKFEEWAVHEMGEAILTTPAISGGTLYLRTQAHLFALGEGKGEPGGNN